MSYGMDLMWGQIPGNIPFTPHKHEMCIRNENLADKSTLVVLFEFTALTKPK